MATRIGVDIGGTFTDLVFYDEESGETVEGKVLTVPNAPEEGVVEAVSQHVPAEKLGRARFFLHGTTVGLNALLERRGAKVRLLTTEGFRDVLEIRRGDRAEMYNLFWKQPEPLVPRHRRLGVPERMMTTGVVYRPLEEAATLVAARQLMAEGVDSIAVCLLNAFANPAHELRIEAILRAAGFAGGISLSHRISGEFREYERTSTTVIDAFVRGRMANYLQRLDGRLREMGFAGTSLITRSGSGSMTFSEAEARPFETIMSGPVGGAHGAAELARVLNLDALITADVGGTSFDTALVLNGSPQILYEGNVDGMPVQTPWVDVRSIGSGGGSIAHVDIGGLMRVGPRSAGAVPGTAAYGRGGVEPAMTDAAAYLGMLGPGVHGLRHPHPRFSRGRNGAKGGGRAIGAGDREYGDRRDAHRGGGHGGRDARDHRRTRTRSARHGAAAVRRGRAADGGAAGRGIADDENRRAALRRQFLRVGLARRRHGAIGGAHQSARPRYDRARGGAGAARRPVRRDRAARRFQRRRGAQRAARYALQGPGAYAVGGSAARRQSGSDER